MKLEGERPLPGTPDELWDLLHDPDILVAAIPGCKKLERTGDDAYQGVIGAKVGTIQSRYTTTFEVKDKDRPHSYRLDVKGQGPGGFVQGDVRIELIPNGDATTTMRHQGEAQVGGKIARVGQRMVQAAATMMVDKSLDALQRRVEQELAPAPEPEEAPAAPERTPEHRPEWPVPSAKVFDPLQLIAVVIAALGALLLLTWLFRRGD